MNSSRSVEQLNLVDIAKDDALFPPQGVGHDVRDKAGPAFLGEGRPEGALNILTSGKYGRQQECQYTYLYHEFQVTGVCLFCL